VNTDTYSITTPSIKDVAFFLSFGLHSRKAWIICSGWLFAIDGSEVAVMLLYLEHFITSDGLDLLDKSMEFLTHAQKSLF
jgi:hypothetical protein